MDTLFIVDFGYITRSGLHVSHDIAQHYPSYDEAKKVYDNFTLGEKEYKSIHRLDDDGLELNIEYDESEDLK